MLGFAATGVAMGLGIVWGFTAALREGWLGEILMRAADTVMAMRRSCSGSSSSPRSARRP
jgi:ABC-type dipeptide/oligopeptide/nickel transport system permease subunit